MRPVRVLVGSLPAPLRNALVEAMSSLADLEVVDVAAQPTTILAAAGTVRADVVVLAAVDGGLPGVASHLLDQYPDLWLVAVTADGQRALVAAKRPQVEEVAVPSLAELVRTIRSAGEQPAP
jgi:AmiR/NasT family two-component response regulator